MKQHGLYKHKLHKVWDGMKGRCYRPNSTKYYRYGARGITVCDEWRYDFKVFYDWAIANGWKYGLLMDRIDFNGNYEPSNCRFVTIEQSNTNRSCVALKDHQVLTIRNLHRIGVFTIKELASIYATPYSTMVTLVSERSRASISV